MINGGMQETPDNWIERSEDYDHGEEDECDHQYTENELPLDKTEATCQWYDDQQR